MHSLRSGRHDTDLNAAQSENTVRSAWATQPASAASSAYQMRCVAAILLTAVAVKLALVVSVPVTSDECFHWVQGRELAWGFRDHPPGTAALSWLATAVFGNTALGVRIVPLLGSFVCSGIAYAMLREVGADRVRAATGAAFLQLLPMPGVGMLMVPAVPHAPLVFGAELFFLRAMRRGRVGDHVAWGVLLGAAFLTYYLTAAAVLAAAVFLVRDARGRRVLRDPRLWFGVVVAAAVFAPNLIWNLAQGSHSAMHFQLLERNDKGLSPKNFAAFVGLASIVAGPLLLPALSRAVRALRSAPAHADDWRPLFASFLLVVLALFAVIATVTRSGAHWAVLAYLNVPVLLFAPGAEPLARGWSRGALWLGSVLAATALTVAAVGIERFLAPFVEASIVSATSRARFLHGGDAAVAAHGAALELQRAGELVQLASNRWSLSSVLTFHTDGAARFAVWPPPMRHGRDFQTWNRGSETPVELIYVTTSPTVEESVRAASASVRCIAVIGAPEFAWVHRCSGFVPPAAWR